MDQRSVVMLGAGLWGLVALAAIYGGVERVERDLTLRSRAELAGAGQRWASVRYSGRDAVLAGIAPSTEARAQATALVRALPGVRLVHDQTTVANAAAQ
ncbi:MAG TPA: BON domain-containing protein [Geminicoccaceae bacterium]|nr:BON domain-containing protein [Geminicoccaceae bacterium]